MLERHQLPKRLRQGLEKELESRESIRWLEQPIATFFPRAVIGTCIVLLVPIVFFTLSGWFAWNQASNIGRSVFEITGTIGIGVIAFGTLMPLTLMVYLPIAVWQEARQTIYVITNRRAFALVAGWRTNRITSFFPAELRAVQRRERPDGSGDVIVYTHTSKDYDGDVQTQEIGFKQVRNAKSFEALLRQLSDSGS